MTAATEEKRARLTALKIEVQALERELATEEEFRNAARLIGQVAGTHVRLVSPSCPGAPEHLLFESRNAHESQELCAAALALLRARRGGRAEG